MASGHKGSYFIPQELKTKPVIFQNVGLTEFLVILGAGVMAYLLSNTLHLVLSSLQVPFIIYSILVAIILITPSPWNKQKKIYQSLYYAAVKDRKVYARIYPESSRISETMHEPFIQEQTRRAREERLEYSPLYQSDLQEQTIGVNRLFTSADIDEIEPEVIPDSFKSPDFESVESLDVQLDEEDETRIKELEKELDALL